MYDIYAYNQYLMFLFWMNTFYQNQVKTIANNEIEEDDSGDIEMPEFYDDPTGYWITDESQIDDAPWLISL